MQASKYIRKCPSCGAVVTVGSLKSLPGQHRAHGHIHGQRACPMCGFSGPLATFQRVRRGPAREVAAVFVDKT